MPMSATLSPSLYATQLISMSPPRGRNLNANCRDHLFFQIRTGCTSFLVSHARVTLMTTTLWLRISSIVSLLFAAGHTLGGFQEWSPVGDNPVLRSMKDVHFDTMGVNRSYFDFYMGFGWSISVILLMQAILLWQLA